MANWEKLFSEYNTLVESLSEEDWEMWNKTQDARRELRRKQMLLKARLHAETMSMQKDRAKMNKMIYDAWLRSQQDETQVHQYPTAGESNYAMCA